ncbi:MAG: tRNA (adenosine(37)-N6)-threonylcarbamoyltransferase complex dimerization subunit type 1 TsaB [Verrucomicrobiota bacterium]
MGVILAIETSTPRGSVAVAAEGEVVFAEEFVTKRSHNAALFAPLGRALQRAGPHLSGVVVGLGPGSYTGIRIGIAAAQGVSLARAIPVVGAASLSGLPGKGTLVGDARRDSFFLQERGGGPEIMDEMAFRERIEASPDQPWVTFDARVPLCLEQIEIAQPSAQVLAIAPLDFSKEQPIEPIYLRAPFVTTPNQPRQAISPKRPEPS